MLLWYPSYINVTAHLMIYQHHTVLQIASVYLRTSLSFTQISIPAQKKKKTFGIKSKLKIIHLNFQSIVNKVPEFHCMIETEKPDCYDV